MNWIQLSAGLPRLEAEWMAADIASRMTEGKAVVVRSSHGWQCWRTADKEELDGFKPHKELPGKSAKAFRAQDWRGRRIAPLVDCMEAGQVMEVRRVAM